MSINWENIRYLFQIPITWFKTISKRVFGAYGTNFIVVKEGDDGGTQIDVDEEAFKQAVQEAAGSHDDCVKSVNNTPPDQNGNVDVGTVKTVNHQTPDQNGNVEIVANGNLKAYGQTLLPDQQGNINLPPYVLTVNGQNPDLTTGNLVLNTDGKVQTVNSIPPDGNGDVFLGDLVYSVNDYYPDQNGNVEIDIAAEVNAAIQAGWVSVGTVKYVNGLSPDASGDVDLGTIVTEVDGHAPDSQTGAVDFNLTANKWVKTDPSGHLTVSQDDPIAIDPLEIGYIYNNHGVVSYKDEEYVTIDTAQTVTGEKSFNAMTRFRHPNDINEQTIINGAGVSIWAPANSISMLSLVCGNSTTGTAYL